MTSSRTFSESMFVLVSQRADGNWYPVALQGCLLLFTTADAATTFLHRTKGLPEGAKVSRESGWERVVGIIRLARDEGASLVAVDPSDSVKAVPLDEAISAGYGVRRFFRNCGRADGSVRTTGLRRPGRPDAAKQGRGRRRSPVAGGEAPGPRSSHEHVLEVPVERLGART